ncbi:MAG: aldehyde dehydrogenase family protein [Euzebya sp.]
MSRTITSIINATAVPGAPGGTLSLDNPADLTDHVGEVHLGDSRTILDGARAAKAAQPAWAAMPPPARGRVIQQIGRIIEANKDELARLVTREIGKPFPEALGEVQEMVDTCDFFLGEGRRLYGQTVPSEMPDKQLFTFRRPVGSLVIVTAGNFPVAVPSWYLVPALLCGNTVTWKPAEYAAASAQAVAELFWAGGLPDGVLNLVLTDGPATFEGIELGLDAGVVDKIGFTGSVEVGRKLGELAGRHLQTPCLELGGKNPLVVMPDADLDLAVEGALFSGFGTSGQRCTSLGTVFVHESVHDDFLQRFDTATRAAKVGDPMDPQVLYGPMISQRFCDNFLPWLDMVEGHHSLYGSTGTGRITRDNPREGFIGDPEAGIFCHPTIVDGITDKDELYLNETFGPLVGVGTFTDFDQAIELANGHGYGLSSSIYTTSPVNAFRFAERVSAGMTSINNSTSGAEAHLPFGGNGKSGNGSRQSGIWVIDQFTRWQSVNWDYAGKLQKAQMDIADTPADLDFRLQD